MENNSKQFRLFMKTMLLLLVFNLKIFSQTEPETTWGKISEKWGSLSETEKGQELKVFLEKENYPEPDANFLKTLKKVEDKVLITQLYIDAEQWNSARLLLSSLSISHSKNANLLPIASKYLTKRSPSLEENQAIVSWWHKLLESATIALIQQERENLLTIAIDLKDLKTIFAIANLSEENQSKKLLIKAQHLLLAKNNRWASYSQFSDLLPEIKSKIELNPDSEDYQIFFYYYAQLKPDFTSDVAFKTYFHQFLQEVHKLNTSKRSLLLNTIQNNTQDHSILTEWLKYELLLKKNIAKDILELLINKKEFNLEEIIKKLDPDIMANHVYLEDTTLPLHVKILLLTRWQSNWKPTTNWLQQSDIVAFDETINAESIIMNNKNTQTSSLIFHNNKEQKADFLFFQLKGIDSNEPLLIDIRSNNKTVRIRKHLSDNWQMIRIPLDNERPSNRLEIKIQNENKSTHTFFQISEPTTLTILKK